MPGPAFLPAGAPAIGALILLSVIWGYNFVVMKKVVEFVDPLVFTAARSALGALALFLFAALAGRRLPMPPLATVLGLGLLQTAAFGLLIQWALVQGEAGRTVVLVYSMPFWLVALAAPLLGERLSAARLAAVLAAGVGLLLVVQPWAGQGLPRLGAFLALLAGFVWAVATIVARLAPQPAAGGVLSITAWQLLLGSVLLAAGALALPTGPTDPVPYLWGALAYSSVLATGIAWFLWLYILDRMSAAGAGLSTLLVPVIGSAASWAQLGERPDPLSGLGMLVILAALAGLSVIALRRSRPGAG